MDSFAELLVVWESLNEGSDMRRAKELAEMREVIEAIHDSSSGSDSESDSEPEEHYKCANFEATLDAMTGSDFRMHLRLKRETVDFLILKYSQSTYAPDQSGSGRLRITPRKAIYMYVWYVSNTVTFRQLANLFGVAPSATWSTVQRVTGFFISISDEYIKWPQDAYMFENVKRFEQKRRIPGVCGAIDCTHILIKAPKQHREMYFNRKKAYSIVLQGVVDANKKFIDITCGEPGSLHDYRVLRRSKLFEYAENHYEEMFPNSFYLIGDSAYPSTKWVVSPYKDFGNLTEDQRKFNEILSSTRIVIENAFGLLKGRFRRLLKFTEQTDLKTITKIVVSVCVLHNICISLDDLCDVSEEFETDALVTEDYAEESDPDTTLDRRQNLFNYLRQRNII